MCVTLSQVSHCEFNLIRRFYCHCEAFVMFLVRGVPWDFSSVKNVGKNVLHHVATQVKAEFM